MKHAFNDGDYVDFKNGRGGVVYMDVDEGLPFIETDWGCIGLDEYNDDGITHKTDDGNDIIAVNNRFVC